MKNLFLGFFAVLFLTIINSCKTTALQSEDRALLQKTWKHSYEEKTKDGAEIYRPANYKQFPASMFRQVYDLKANGQCEYLVLHPADAHYMAKGSWSYNSSAKELLIKDTNKKIVAQYKVLELKSDLLKVIKQ